MATIRVPIQQDRTLLNPRFDGYKLSFLDESQQHFVSVGAPGPGVVVPKVSSAATLSYREVQSRVRHNHLYPGWNSLKTPNGESTTIRDGVLFAIDADFMLIALTWDRTTRRLRSKRLIQIPTPVTPLNFHLELPSVKPISPDYVLVSDGASTLYVIRVSVSGTEHEATIEAVTRFRPRMAPQTMNEKKGEDVQEEEDDEMEEDETLVHPCGLLEAKAYTVLNPESGEQAMEIKFVVHYTNRQTFYSTAPSPHHNTDKRTVFIVSLCSLILDHSLLDSARRTADPSHSASGGDSGMELDGPPEPLHHPVFKPCTVIHSIRGTEIPTYCALDPSNEGYVIGSNSTFKPTQEPIVEQKAKYLEPGSAAMGVDGTDVLSPSSTSATEAGTSSNPPYIWMQTSSDVTICFSLPKGTTKHAVECQFAAQGLLLKVIGQKEDQDQDQDQDLSLSDPQSRQRAPLPSIDRVPLFDQIRPEESYWTLERNTGLLTLTMEKYHPKTRWTQIFAEEVDMEPVEETLDPSVFNEYKESLEKYTTDQANAGAMGSSLLPTVAQDPHEEIDDEGEEIKFSWVLARDGTDIIQATTMGSGHDWISQSFANYETENGDTDQGGITDASGNNLGHNNNGAGSWRTPRVRMPTVCLKHNVDGLVYAIQHTAGSFNKVVATSTVRRVEDGQGILRLSHVGTYDALAFVQASKREKRFVMHDPLGRFAVVVESSRNAYVYYHTPDKKLAQEPQVVVDVSKGQLVDIIGCQLIAEGILVILMEGKHGALVLELNRP
ncbi:hypothetical protein BGW38_002585 [Lunasporangiospora selenospora]|uniref:NudC domain-containing protein 1 n=1 Tax=Lunasporangiospora selenospora TaxID=979761 RepID=A0A9P6KDB5_9FUNG|nr:hypothetical protein BGW38_002585 [Lunasporangiospora selenospora]